MCMTVATKYQFDKTVINQKIILKDLHQMLASILDAVVVVEIPCLDVWMACLFLVQNHQLTLLHFSIIIFFSKQFMIHVTQKKTLYTCVCAVTKFTTPLNLTISGDSGRIYYCSS